MNRVPEEAYFGSGEWLTSLGEVAAAIGQPDFGGKLFALLSNVLQIDHCAVFTWSEQLGAGHLFTRSKMPEAQAEALARDYVSKYHARDPHFGNGEGRGSAPVHPLLEEDYDPDYQQHFFTRHNLIDKIATVGDASAGKVYCNVYRMGESEPFSTAEKAVLNRVLPLLTGLIAAHWQIARFAAGSDSEDSTRAARRMIDAVVGQRIPPFDALTDREAEICTRILIGYTSTGISLDLGIAASSVNTYRRRAYERLGIATQNELFSLCLSALDRARN